MSGRAYLLTRMYHSALARVRFALLLRCCRDGALKWTNREWPCLACPYQHISICPVAPGKSSDLAFPRACDILRRCLRGSWLVVLADHALKCPVRKGCDVSVRGFDLAKNLTIQPRRKANPAPCSSSALPAKIPAKSCSSNFGASPRTGAFGVARLLLFS